MAAQQWKMVRIPEHLAERLDALAEATHKAHVEGRITLPAQFADRVPTWLVIERLLAEVEARRERSRRPRKRPV
jgi:DNA-directed RNA polymerase sigma subunit (sigma70/sigma32)